MQYHIHLSFSGIEQLAPLVEAVASFRKSDGRCEIDFYRELVASLDGLGEFGDQARHILDGPASFLVVDGLSPLLNGRLCQVQRVVAALCSAVGTPTTHDQEQRLVWHVRDQAEEETRALTFSERTGFAPFHTDSSFIEAPEEFFALFAVQPAQTGGLSQLVRADDIVRTLEADDGGRDCLETLRSCPFPFKVPAAFQSADRPAVVFHTILQPDGTIRYRRDSIAEGMAAAPEAVITDRMQWALDRFDALLRDGVRPFELRLESGQMLMANNRRLLHARSDFSDCRRHLIRVRMRRSAVVADQEGRTPLAA